jgi:hypothetical protein
MPGAVGQKSRSGSSVAARRGRWRPPGRAAASPPIDPTPAQVIAAVRRMNVAERRAFIEDLLAATSPEYLAGIREARADRRAGRVKSLREVFRA